MHSSRMCIRHSESWCTGTSNQASIGVDSVDSSAKMSSSAAFHVYRLLCFTHVDAISVSNIGMSPSLSGWEIHYELMDTEALHACNDSHIAVIQLGQRMVCL
jgi:hypothetical protein